jgi:ATP-dependent DNA helicase PIF1
MDPTLTDEQEQVLQSVIQSRRNVFITGSAGVGKSFLVKHICLELTKKGLYYALVAPTGVAAVNIGGITIHRFAGLRPVVQTFADYVRTRSGKPSNWKSIDVLIIDEISMIHPDLFDLLNIIAKYHRKSNSPMGGIQVVLIGDLLQLPYVPNSDDKNIRKYIFETDTWQSLNVDVFLMRKVMRQNDLLFISALNDLRFGQITDNVTKVLHQVTTNKRKKGKHYIKLFALNVLKDNENEVQLKKLDEPPVYYDSEDTGEASLLKGCLASKTLVLKKGCPVMLLRNMPNLSLCNGSVGIVESFENGLPVVKFNTGVTVSIDRHSWEITERFKNGFKILASRRQIPLVLAYALSQHKSQGLTIDHLEVDCTGIFTTGQLYTALSRASTMKGLRLKNFHESSLIVDESISKFYAIHSADNGITVPPPIGTGRDEGVGETRVTLG